MTSNSPTGAARRSSGKRAPFSYYRRLSPALKRIYQRSDAVSSIPIAAATFLFPRIHSVMEVLSLGDRSRTEEATQALVMDLVRLLNVMPVKVCVLEQRPSRNWGELHGLYERNPGWRYPKITVWMRTAKREEVVAPKTFLRTLFHEVAHHLDYTYLRLPHSFHTMGFYQRESSLVKQLIP